MKITKKKPRLLPKYHGQEWINARLPDKGEPWLLGKYKSAARENINTDNLNNELGSIIRNAPWTWPRRPIFFFSDLHADADALQASLVASGGIKKTGAGDFDYKLTWTGHKARFVIGGDCFDKGPSNLRLLRNLRKLRDKGARLHLLAGNHDIRVKLGMRSVDLDKDPRSEHFFIRMGAKVIPFLKEIEQEYLQGNKSLQNIPDTRECKKRLYPSESWFEEFPKVARWLIPEKAIAKETRRLREKLQQFEQDCARAGLSLRMVYAASKKWQQLFLHPKGEFYWFYKDMRLVLHKGSFLFVHAGLDDRVARVIKRKGTSHLNRQFSEHVSEELFEFYYGPLANTIRTKYRDVDMPLTRHGVKMLKYRGIHAIVHGHKNMRFGQRIMLRKGMINFECDASVDSGTRKKEGFTHYGAAVTIFSPDARVYGISADYPFVKVFDPNLLIS